MGKGNFILGTGSSSIGDVTFSRRNGQQIARVRVRKIKNPKSYGQAEQRMIAAEVVKFYSPLSGVLETSFEGLNKSESYAKFLSVNNNLMRADAIGVVKGSGFTAIPAVLSNGSLPTPSVKFQDGEESLELVTGAITGTGTEGAKTMGDLSTALITKYDLQDGDQVTFIYVTLVDGEQVPHYFRFFVDTTDTTLISTLFDVDVKSDEVGIFPISLLEFIALGVIFSRWDGEKWARSNSRMVCTADYLATLQGTNYEAAIASYMKGAGRTPVSDVYLNGNDD